MTDTPNGNEAYRHWIDEHPAAIAERLRVARALEEEKALAGQLRAAVVTDDEQVLAFLESLLQERGL